MQLMQTVRAAALGAIASTATAPEAVEQQLSQEAIVSTSEPRAEALRAAAADTSEAAIDALMGETQRLQQDPEKRSQPQKDFEYPPAMKEVLQALRDPSVPKVEDRISIETSGFALSFTPQQHGAAYELLKIATQEGYSFKADHERHGDARITVTDPEKNIIGVISASSMELALSASKADDMRIQLARMLQKDLVSVSFDEPVYLTSRVTRQELKRNGIEFQPDSKIQIGEQPIELSGDVHSIVVSRGHAPQGSLDKVLVLSIDGQPNAEGFLNANKITVTNGAVSSVQQVQERAFLNVLSPSGAGLTIDLRQNPKLRQTVEDLIKKDYKIELQDQLEESPQRTLLIKDAAGTAVGRIQVQQ